MIFNTAAAQRMAADPTATVTYFVKRARRWAMSGVSFKRRGSRGSISSDASAENAGSVPKKSLSRPTGGTLTSSGGMLLPSASL